MTPHLRRLQRGRRLDGLRCVTQYSWKSCDEGFKRVGDEGSAGNSCSRGAESKDRTGRWDLMPWQRRRRGYLATSAMLGHPSPDGQKDGKRGYLVDLSRNREGPRGNQREPLLHTTSAPTKITRSQSQPQHRPSGAPPSDALPPAWSRCCSCHSPSHHVSMLGSEGYDGRPTCRSHAD